MRLYSRTGATAHDQPGYGLIEPGPDGGFDFPDDVAEEVLSFHIGKKPLWETEIGHAARLAAEEEARMRDPATLAALVAQLVKAQAPPPAVPAAPKAAPAKGAPKAPARGATAAASK
jgi:hypothetical protein